MFFIVFRQKYVLARPPGKKSAPMDPSHPMIVAVVDRRSLFRVNFYDTNMEYYDRCLRRCSLIQISKYTEQHRFFFCPDLACLMVDPTLVLLSVIIPDS